jgi:hypothetical protein
LSKRGWLILGAVVGGLVLASFAFLFAMRGKIRDMIRSETVAYLRLRFHSDIEFKDFEISLRPGVHVVIDDVVMRHNGRTDVPPLIEVAKVSFYANISGLLQDKVTVSSVRLDGLQIHTPPRRPGGPPLIQRTDADLAKNFPIVIGEVIADDAVIVQLPKDPSRTTHPFYIHHLQMENFRFDQPADFHAILTNPAPRGEIDCVGKFGPWDGEQPSETPVDAKFDFEHADLGTLKGLSGLLSSKGKFKGPLDYLEVEGETDTPDFALRTASHPVPLHTVYSAIVDGTNGDVILNKVTATFLHTTIVARGEVVDLTTRKGRTIDLDAVSDKGRVEDLLRLTVKTDKPVMTGYERLKTKIFIPERDEDLIDRMSLDGQFAVGDIQFTNNEIQDRIDTFSHKAQGKPQLGAGDTELSELRGTFTMANTSVKFSNLTFGVEGASIALAGTYGVNTGELDFRGKLRMEARISQTVTGKKSFFLKAVDPFFRKNGVTEIPVKITGTKDAPKYGLDLHDKANKEPAGVTIK